MKDVTCRRCGHKWTYRPYGDTKRYWITCPCCHSNIQIRELPPRLKRKKAKTIKMKGK